MKVALLLCLAFITTSFTVSAISRTEILALLQQDYTIDKVLELFQALKAQESQDLATVDSNYATDEPNLSNEIARTQDLLTSKNNDCNNIQTIEQGQETELQRQQDNVQSAQNTIASNLEKVKGLEDARCASNLLYIGRLGQNQEAIEFLRYLREKVQEPTFASYLNANPQTLIQMKSAFAGKQTDEVLSVLTQHHLLSLIQQDAEYTGEDQLNYNVQARTDAEIGTDQIDNDRGALQRQQIDNQELSSSDYVNQLVGYIDLLLENLQSSTDALQTAEQEAVQALISYRNKIKDENFVLARFIEATNARVVDLNGVIANNLRALGECQALVPPLDEGRRVAQQNYDTYVTNYHNRRDNLVNTIDLLDQVIQVYTDEVVNVAGSDYKERTEDYIADQTFDQTGGFTARASVEAIDSYGN